MISSCHHLRNWNLFKVTVCVSFVKESTEFLMRTQRSVFCLPIALDCCAHMCVCVLFGCIWIYFVFAVWHCHVQPQFHFQWNSICVLVLLLLLSSYHCAIHHQLILNNTDLVNGIEIHQDKKKVLRLIVIKEEEKRSEIRVSYVSESERERSSQTGR